MLEQTNKNRCGVLKIYLLPEKTVQIKAVININR